MTLKKYPRSTLLNNQYHMQKIIAKPAMLIFAMSAPNSMFLIIATLNVLIGTIWRQYLS